uniref:Uncharacterized protein n=1 Tax=Tetraodon nigroviridis TaxID=99883 RepID=H3C3M0_TETNG
SYIINREIRLDGKEDADRSGVVGLVYADTFTTNPDIFVQAAWKDGGGGQVTGRQERGPGERGTIQASGRTDLLQTRVWKGSLALNGAGGPQRSVTFTLPPALPSHSSQIFSATRRSRRIWMCFMDCSRPVVLVLTEPLAV